MLRYVPRFFRELHTRTEIKVRSSEKKVFFMRYCICRFESSAHGRDVFRCFVKVERHLAVWVSWVFNTCTYLGYVCFNRIKHSLNDNLTGLFVFG